MALSAEQQINDWLKDIERAADKFDKRDRRKVLRAGANPVRKTARSRTKERKGGTKSTIGLRPNPRYKRKAKGAPRAKRGQGDIVAKYVPGNLKKSMQTLTFRRSKDVFVGPKLRTKSGKPLRGRTVGTADGYYVAMLYGSGKQFRSRVLVPALRQNASQVRKLVFDKARQLIPQYSGKGP